jgi:hypothetical protein
VTGYLPEVPRVKPRTLTGGIIIAALLIGCSESRECNCGPPTLTVQIPAGLAVSGVKVCVDNDCSTVRTYANQIPRPQQFASVPISAWQEGKRVHLTIDVYGNAGAALGTYVSEQSLTNAHAGGCSCPLLAFHLDGASITPG